MKHYHIILHSVFPYFTDIMVFIFMDIAIYFFYIVSLLSTFASSLYIVSLHESDYEYMNCML